MTRFADGFRVDLLEQGYSLWGAQEQLYLLAHVSRWMESERLEVAALTPGNLQRYFAWRRQQGYLKSLSPLSLRRLLGYLDGLGVLPPDGSVPSPVDRLLGEFREYLLHERGMKATSAAQYEPTARLFLSERPEPLEDGLARVSAAEVSTFVLREARRRSTRSAETVVFALRALLRFLHVQGLIAERLVDAVPSVARRREDLPRGLPVEQVRLLLDSCDRSLASGRRDYAILLLLSRLGLRRGEVAALSLDDVDWWAGEIVVRGKGSRIDRLPLPCVIRSSLGHVVNVVLVLVLVSEATRILSASSTSSLPLLCVIVAGGPRMPGRGAQRRQRPASSECAGYGCRSLAGCRGAWWGRIGRSLSRSSVTWRG